MALTMTTAYLDNVQIICNYIFINSAQKFEMYITMSMNYELYRHLANEQGKGNEPGVSALEELKTQFNRLVEEGKVTALSLEPRLRRMRPTNELSVLLPESSAPLPPKLETLYRYLFEHSNTICSREELTQAIWGDKPPKSPDALEQLVKRTRQITGEGKAGIIGLRGVGYVRLSNPPTIKS